MGHSRVYEDSALDWGELSELDRIAPLGEKSPKDLATVFSNSRFKCLSMPTWISSVAGELWLTASTVHT